ncbi:hypothetical protein SAMN04487760_1083 [Lachnospiraceae bacterium G41]|nr:hypothetical protein SAMN04487760_1083 [Lachnospiraceae bacterium G41]
MKIIYVNHKILTLQVIKKATFLGWLFVFLINFIKIFSNTYKFYYQTEYVNCL